MTKEELELAQFFHNLACRSNALAERRDPERKQKDEIAFMLDGLCQKAAIGFLRLVGRPWYSVTAVELHTEEPAPWTRKSMINGVR